MDIQIGDIIKLKKQHPCGSKEWEVLRVGADFRLKCLGCGHQIMIARKLLEKNVKEINELNDLTPDILEMLVDTLTGTADPKPVIMDGNEFFVAKVEYGHEYCSKEVIEELKKELENKNRTQTWAICAKPFSLVGIKRTTKKEEQKLENYEWRVKCLSEKVDLEVLAIVLQEINGQINNSSGYLGNISDRSKELYFNKITVGQYLMEKLSANPHFSLKNIVFH